MTEKSERLMRSIQWPLECRPYFDSQERSGGVSLRSKSVDGVALSALWTVPELCRAYRWPRDLTGGGVIGILAMAGGYKRSDLKTYFEDLDEPMPTIVDVPMGGFDNNPGKSMNDKDDPDVEVTLDIQVAASSYYAATGRPATIRLYWTGKDLLAIAPAILQAAADGCAVFSASWGAPEEMWEAMTWKLGRNVAVELETAVISAAMRGMTVFAASGDQEATNGGQSLSVNLPAACPHVVGCGGTSKQKHRKRNEVEKVWNSDPGKPNGFGTGGGYSSIFVPQFWARGAPAGSGRIVPDVSGNADKTHGYRIHVHGEYRPTGGTSAVAPLYAGLFAAFDKKGKGFVNQTLWRNRDCFQDITKGGNDGYEAGKGPDACSGLGVPIGRELATLFMARQAAPQIHRKVVEVVEIIEKAEVIEVTLPLG
jgi:subtilase family serine protease